MAPQTAKSLMKDFRASFRRKKTMDTTPKIDKAKALEEEELAKLAELKEKLGENLPSEYDDAHLLSFIRARALNVKDAEKLLKLDINTKKILLLDTLVKDYDVSDLSKNYQCSAIIGVDKDGCLVRVMKIAICDIKGNICTISTIEHFKVFMWFMEKDLQRMEVENKKCGKKNNQIVYIIDLGQINVSKILYKPVLDTALVALKLLQDHYFGLAKSIYILNTPALFPSAYKVFKAVLQESIQQKIKIYGCDGYGEELLKHIDADVLPAYLGGNKVDSNGDPACADLIGRGGLIPKSYYPDHFLNTDDEDVVVVTVAAGTSLSCRFYIPEAGTRVRYHIQAKENDIGIGLFLDRDGVGEEGVFMVDEKKKDEDISKLEQLCPIIRSQCHLCPEVGTLVSWFSGMAILYLDNTYSWMSSKEAAFRVTMEPRSQNSAINSIRSLVMVPKNTPK